jgi:hypothetical protein
MISSRKVLLVLLAGSLCLPFLHAQQPTAAQFVASEASLLYGTTTVNNFAIDGNVTRTFGTDNESGTIRMQADSTGRMRIDTTIGANIREEYYSGFGETPDCIWTDQSGQHPMSKHNCHMAGVFFAPLILAPTYEAGTNFSIALSSGDQGNAILTISKMLASTTSDAGAVTLIQTATKAQVLFDATTFLPMGYRYPIHPDNDARTNIPVEVRFSNYQMTNGVKFPFHIQKFVNGNLELDITVTNVAVNSNLTISK